MSAALRPSMTQDAFLAWAEGQNARFEFDGIQPVAMTGGSASHSRLGRRLLRLLEDRLAGSGCEPLGPDMGVETVGGAVRYPDALVTCQPPKGTDKLARGVVLVVEVISPSSSRTDRIEKLREYQAVPSIRRYVIVEQDSVALAVFERPDAGAWQASALTEGDVLHMPEIGVSFSLAEVYAGILAERPTDPMAPSLGDASVGDASVGDGSIGDG